MLAGDRHVKSTRQQEQSSGVQGIEDVYSSLEFGGNIAPKSSCFVQTPQVNDTKIKIENAVRRKECGKEHEF